MCTEELVGAACGRACTAARLHSRKLGAKALSFKTHLNFHLIHAQNKLSEHRTRFFKALALRTWVQGRGTVA